MNFLILINVSFMYLGIRRYNSWGRERRDRRNKRTNRVRCNCLVSLCPGFLEVSRTFFRLFCKIVSGTLISGTSLVVQWLRFCLPMQEVQVQFLVGELRSPCASWPKTQNINSRSNIVTHSVKTFKMVHIGLPWQLSGKESACHRRRRRYDPRSGKIPRAPEQLSLCALISEPVLQGPGDATTEAHTPRACASQQEKPRQWKALAPQLESSPRSPPPGSNEDPAQPKIKSINKQNYKKCFTWKLKNI